MRESDKLQKNTKRIREKTERIQKNKRKSDKIRKNTRDSEIMREKPKNLGNPRNEN